MSRNSKKAGRPTVPRDPATYLPKVAAMLRLLKSSGDAWDADRGEEHVASMVLGLRLLLVDGLVDRVQALKRLLFVDTALHGLGRSGSVEGSSVGGGLTVFSLSEGGSEIVPMCHAMAEPEPPSPFLPFPRWWNDDDAVRHGNRGFSRHFLVYEMANTDAVHIDGELDADYESILGAVPGVTFGGPTGYGLPALGVAQASIRQIAWETHRSLVSNLLPRFPGIVTGL